MRSNLFKVQLRPLTKELESREHGKGNSLDLKQAGLCWIGCVPHKAVVHLLTTKIITSYILDCNKISRLLHMHNFLQRTQTLGALLVKLTNHETVHASVLQPYPDGIAILSLLNMTDTFHGEQKILQLTFESRCEETFQGHIKETFEDFKSRLLKKFLNKENSEHRGVTSKPNVHPNNLISRYAPGSSANIMFVHHQPSTLCDFRKEHEDFGYSASSRSSKPNNHTLKSSTSSRSGTMVEKAMNDWKANSGTVENTDNNLHSAPCSPDRRSYNSNGLIDKDIKGEEDLKNYLVKQYELVLSAEVAAKTAVRGMVSIATKYMNNLLHNNPEKSAAVFVKKLLVKSYKELKDNYTQNSDRDRKIAEYKLQVLLLLELEFVTRNDEADHDAVLNELILFLRGLMFVTDPIHLNDFLLEVVISYAVAVPKLLTDVYDELMLPLPPALSRFASPVSSKAPMSVLNEDSFMSAPSSTQPSSHLSDQASQPARSRFKQHPCFLHFQHFKQILVKPKSKTESKSSAKEKGKAQCSLGRQVDSSSIPVEINRQEKFSIKKKLSQFGSKEEVKKNYKKRTQYSGKPETLVLGTPSHKQTSQRFLFQQKQRRQRENVDADIKVIAESPIKADADPSLASALTKSAGHLPCVSFYKSSSQPSKYFSHSIELSQKSSSQINHSQESQSVSPGTLSSAVSGYLLKISSKKRFIQSFLTSPSTEQKTKSSLRRSQRKSAKKLEFC
ncbi:uncharacterized protein LOC106074537 [Biomphalaria glabrata]|uniref:Uncharacterized protein LOC106074537 n=1 Tax=Biomphalaria glabrata TaxID=6526 RepID=A0A9W2ZFW7_BIOGL|nr:uncharacterized protein LOC106074537 [Biomphalaria glabrata]KAI8777508.1 treslin isoform X3 [Biomphalaria glabrata]